jgi:hypothetical protein
MSLFSFSRKSVMRVKRAASKRRIATGDTHLESSVATVSLPSRRLCPEVL